MARTKQVAKKQAAKKKTSVNSKKPYRFRPGTVALREIRKYQKSTELLIPRAPFNRYVRELFQDHMTDFRFTHDMFEALHTAAEEFLTTLFRQATVLTVKAKRVTLMPGDMQTVIEIRNDKN